MHILEKAESGLTRLLEGFISACLLLVFVLIVTLVVLRYVFKDPPAASRKASAHTPTTYGPFARQMTLKVSRCACRHRRYTS